MKRIRVPDGMLKAIQKAWFEYVADDSDHQRLILEAALLWLSEHPQVPTPAQYTKLRNDLEDDNGMVPLFPEMFAEWQRRCFQEEEPEIPEEIKDLLEDARSFPNHEIAGMIIDAYRRGLTRGSVALRKGGE